MTPIDKLLTASASLKAACEEVSESGYGQPDFVVLNVPRELFDEIPAISRVDDDDPDDPFWEKWFKGIRYTCYQAPMVKL